MCGVLMVSVSDVELLRFWSFNRFFDNLSFSLVIVDEKSSRIIPTTNQITVQWMHVDCRDEVVGFIKYSVEFH